jgi:LPS sulfotransferase NodH
MRDISRVGRMISETDQWFHWLEKQGVDFVPADGVSYGANLSGEFQAILQKFIRAQNSARSKAAHKRKRESADLSDHYAVPYG